MDNEQKRITRERHERYLKKHYRTYEEEKQLQSEIRARRAGRPPRRHSRSPEPDEEDGSGFEKIPAAPRAARPRQATHELPPSPLELPPTARSALVVAVHRTHVRL